MVALITSAFVIDLLEGVYCFSDQSILAKKDVPKYENPDIYRVEDRNAKTSRRKKGWT